MTWTHFRDLLPIITFILGAGLTVLTEWVRTRWTETARREVAREEFIRGAVLQLQDVLDEIADAAQDYRAERRGSDDGKVDSVDYDRFHRVSLTGYGLLVRLPSKALRDMVEDFLTVAHEVATGDSDDRIGHFLSTGTDDAGRVVDMLARLNALTEEFGAILRRLHGLTE